jgi:histidinol-phosphate aminotransferase
MRAGWMQSPLLKREGAQALHAAAQALAPSWVVSAEGVQLLMHWHDDDVQSWLSSARQKLNAWMQAMQHDLNKLGWRCEPSTVPFFLAHPKAGGTLDMQRLLTFLRSQGIKLRDAHSMGVPGHVRLRALGPQAQEALLRALSTWADIHPSTRKVA